MRRTTVERQVSLRCFIGREKAREYGFLSP